MSSFRLQAPPEPVGDAVDYDESNDAQLLEAWREGDPRAGAALFSRYHPSMVRFFALKVGYERSDDLVQETFLGLRQGLERFHVEKSVRPLLYAIARNQLNYYLRQLVRDRKRFAYDPMTTSLADIGTTPTQRLVGHERNQLLLRALRQLPVNTQVMIELHYWERLPLREIAMVMELPVNTVKTRLFRARKQLEASMAQLAESSQQLESSLEELSAWARRVREEAGRAPE